MPGLQGQVDGDAGQVINLMISVSTMAPINIGSQKSLKIEQLSATIDSQAKPLR